MSGYSPNPYNSYFDGGPSSMALNTPAGISGMIGAAQGGFNPTRDEYWQRRKTTDDRQRFLSDAYRTDPRTLAASAMLTHQLFGQEHAQRNAFMKKIGGHGNFHELVGWAMNHPMTSGMTGGSVHSLAVGSLGAMSTGNVTYRGGNTESSYGDHFLSVMAARSMLNHVNKTFYDKDTGAARLSATQGLNRDQIGGIMQIAGAQGAFAGLNIGKMTATGFDPNQGTITRITDFTKNAAKFISGLIDVFGQGSIGQLLGKAQAITGLDLSREANAGIMRSRLSGLRNTANAYGMDVAAVYGLAQAGTAYGQSLGLDQTSAGALSDQATRAAAGDFRSRQAMAGGMHLPSRSIQELTQIRMNEIHAMTIADTTGQLRMSTELMFEHGHGTEAQRQDIRARLAAARPGASTHDTADYITKTLGRSPYQLMSDLGGPAGVLANLSTAGQSRVFDMGKTELRERQKGVIRTKWGDVADQIFGERGEELSRNGNGRIRGVLAAIQQDPQLASFRSDLDLKEDRNRIFAAGAGRVTSEDRGFAISSGLVSGFLDRLSGKDPNSQYQMAMAMIGPENILGSRAGDFFSLDAKHYEGADGYTKATASMQALHRAVGGMHMSHRKGGQALLTKLGIGLNGVGNAGEFIAKLNDPNTQAELNRDFMLMQSDNGGTQMVPRATADAVEAYGPRLAQLNGMRVLMNETGDKGGFGGYARIAASLDPSKQGEDIDRILNLGLDRITDYNTLSKIDPKRLSKMDPQGHGGLGRTIADSAYLLRQKFAAAAGMNPTTAEEKGASRKRDEMELLLKHLKDNNIIPKAELAPGSQQISGTLQLMFPDGSKIPGVLKNATASTR